MVDRFNNADASNDNSYGRKKTAKMKLARSTAVTLKA